jgi:hypothetical protein
MGSATVGFYTSVNRPGSKEDHAQKVVDVAGGERRDVHAAAGHHGREHGPVARENRGMAESSRAASASATAFFVELGLKLLGEVEGGWWTASWGSTASGLRTRW